MTNNIKVYILYIFNRYIGMNISCTIDQIQTLLLHCISTLPDQNLYHKFKKLDLNQKQL